MSQRENNFSSKFSVGIGVVSLEEDVHTAFVSVFVSDQSRVPHTPARAPLAPG
jgi:hypothetical protein